MSREESYGRVVRLHFACRAELPIGSSLRVTSSQLWAPGTLTPSDPNDAKTVIQQASELALPDNSNVDGEEGHGASALAGMSHSIVQSYASSVEMVTSPDQWPLWKTKKPVVISLRHHHGRFEQHRYRYMVVTPGAKPGGSDYRHNFNDDNNQDNDDHDDNLQTQTIQGTTICTSNDADFATEVMAWEDPFHSQDKQVRHYLDSIIQTIS